MESNPVVVEAEAFVDASVAAFTAVLSGAAVAGTTGSGTAVSGLGGVEPGADAGGVGDDPLQRVA
ncbi:hypothetical protein, partial [Pseudarthrobacter oxydans]|uniref:hypothetical protein n=1 Tax=Pseudarthrobacter oxydans TaxID=1671 RepID=UPI00344CC49F